MGEQYKKLIDTLTERTLEARVNDRVYSFRHVSLGVAILAESALSEAGWSMGDNEDAAMRIAHDNLMILARYIAYHAASNKAQALDEQWLSETAKEFSRLSPEEIASLSLVLMDRVNISDLLEALGVADEVKARERELKGRDNNDWISFGGRTIYGVLIDPLAERYGWTMDYILWGVSYANIRMLLSDQQSSIYKGASSGQDPVRVINADNPENEDEIDRIIGEG